jgi:hypothetical protein
LPGATGRSRVEVSSTVSPIARGSHSVNVVPWPALLSSVMVPPASCTMVMAVDRPSPVPWALVVKNASNTRLVVSGLMPWPVSDTDRASHSLPRRRGAPAAAAAWPGTIAVRSVSLPPRGMASRAFSARLSSTCSSWPWSISIPTETGARSTMTCVCSPITVRSIFSRSVITAATSMTRRSSACWRENASRRRASADPRSAAPRMLRTWFWLRSSTRRDSSWPR